MSEPRRGEFARLGGGTASPRYASKGLCEWRIISLNGTCCPTGCCGCAGVATCWSGTDAAVEGGSLARAMLTCSNKMVAQADARVRNARVVSKAKRKEKFTPLPP